MEFFTFSAVVCMSSNLQDWKNVHQNFCLTRIQHFVVLHFKWRRIGRTPASYLVDNTNI